MTSIGMRLHVSMYALNLASSSHGCHGDHSARRAAGPRRTRRRGCRRRPPAAGTPAIANVSTDQKHPGAVVEHATRGRVVEHRWTHRGHRSVTEVEPIALVDESAPVERGHPLLGHPADREPGRHQRRVRARLERGEQVARVVAVVVAQEDPADVVGVDDAAETLSSHSSRLAGDPVSTSIGCSPRMTREFMQNNPTGGASKHPRDDEGLRSDLVRRHAKIRLRRGHGTPSRPVGS